MEVVAISAQELHARREKGQRVHLIDVRTPMEYREVHADLAENVPLDRLDPEALLAPRSAHPDEPLYVICRSGSRSEQACRRLQAAGHANVLSIEGGTLAWTSQGLPVVRGKKAISLERQVRIAAGSLVLLGVILGWTVHPALLGLSAFVGAGLVFAGVTDTCGMGLLLARMPWNHVPQDASCSPAPDSLAGKMASTSG